MIAGGAGVVVGIMNVSGLAQSLSFILTQTGNSLGLVPMLALTAILSIILGMGMPSTAIYVVLATVIGPSLTRMGVEPLAAHLFIFYFGVMSFLTPPVAVSSYVAAGLAKAGMWETGWTGMRYSAVAFVLPFLWCYEPALLLDADWLSIMVVACATLSAIKLFSMQPKALSLASAATSRIAGLLLACISLGVACAPALFGATSISAMAVTLVAFVLAFIVPSTWARTGD